MREQANALYHKSSDQRKKAHLRTLKRYGITAEDYDHMFAEQNGLCAICGRPDSRALSVDHDHETGKVRGLLCSKCNFLLGYADDDPEILTRAIEYLAEVEE